jgi:hypothetical protein
MVSAEPKEEPLITDSLAIPTVKAAIDARFTLTSGEISGPTSNFYMVVSPGISRIQRLFEG